jgi:hypothetical protein
VHAQIITYHLKNVGQDEYLKICLSLAPVIARQPGLLGMVWLASPMTNTYGGTYTWRDRKSMLAFMKSDLVRSFAAHPSIVGLMSEDFEVLEQPSVLTRGVEAVGVA